MQLVADHGSPADAFSAGRLAQATVWRREVYDALVSALGAAPVLGIARRFHTHLGTRFADHACRDELRRDAHAIVSAAGMLGFFLLSDAAKALEHACQNEGDVTQPLAALLSAQIATDRCLIDVLQADPLQEA